MASMFRAQRKVSESTTSMRWRDRSGNEGSRGESSGYVVEVMKELDEEAPGVVAVMCSDLFIVSSQIWRRVAMSGMVFASLQTRESLTSMMFEYTVDAMENMRWLFVSVFQRGKVDG